MKSSSPDPARLEELKRQAERRRQTANERSRARSAAGQELPSIPPIKDPIRRAVAETSFKSFCEIYLKKQFNLAWSDHHLVAIDKIERVVIDLEKFAVAMPRGSGKTTLCEAAVLWAVLTGKHHYVFLVGSTNEDAEQMMGNIQHQLYKNKLLLQDFPEAVFPFWQLQGESRRCTGQKYRGVNTNIAWSTSQIIFADIPGSTCSGAIIEASGITGSIRGANHVLPDGEKIRPTLVIVDDPQTDQSARSPMQITQRLSIINGAIKGLAGPGQNTAIIIPCTVIQPLDLADQLLDRTKNPTWQGERTKMLIHFPSNMKLWDQYAKIRSESYAADGNGSEATDFYRENREAMDEGAEVSWLDRYTRKKEISALQAAMNLFYDDEESFYAEYQNEPVTQEADGDVLTPEALMDQINHRAQCEIPFRAHFLTAFIDVHDKILYYVVCAWEQDFTGWIVDYGSYPDQKRAYFTHRKPHVSMDTLYKGIVKDAVIQAGLKDLVAKLMSYPWKKAGGGGIVKIDRIFIDAGYKPGIIENVKREMDAPIMSSKGVSVKAGNKPMSSYRRKPGERYGEHWMIPNVKRTTGEYPYVLIDTNYWKTFSHERLMAAGGEPGSLTLFGTKPEIHRMFAEHVAGSESWTKTEGHGRVVHQWTPVPGSPDNHWLDCLVGNCVAASLCGCKLVGHASKVESKKKIKLSQIQRERRA